jgi:hypothetical protein
MTKSSRLFFDIALIACVTSVALAIGFYLGRTFISQSKIAEFKKQPVLASYEVTEAKVNQVINSQTGAVVIEDASALCGSNSAQYSLGEIASSESAVYVREFSQGDAPPAAIYRITFNPIACVPLQSNSFGGFAETVLSPDKKILAAADDNKLIVVDLAKDISKTVVTVQAPETLAKYEGMGAVYDFKWLNNYQIEYSVYQKGSDDTGNTFLRIETVLVSQPEPVFGL